MKGLEIRNLSKRYGARKILYRLDFRVRESEIAAVTGTSGSGKTTLLLCVLGFIAPDDGDILIDGRNVGGVPIQERHIAYMPQDYGLFPHLDVAGNIAFALAIRNADKRARKKRVMELLKAVNLPSSFSARSIDQLSGGEKQRVALARAMALEPKLFLLDEPLSAIDPETKREVAAQLRSLITRLRIPTVMIFHDPEEARMLADSVWRLESGKLKRTSST